MTSTAPPVPGRPVTVKVWGDLACFTRPEYSAEKVSYPVLTPTAAVGLLEAVFWKPEVAWRVRAIDVLRPVAWSRLFRNGISSRQTAATARRWAARGTGAYDAAHDRAQLNALLLRDVAYVVHADLLVVRGDDPPAKYRDQFRRRVTRGQFLVAPYLGCREFLADFADPAETDTPIEVSFPVGPLPHSFERDERGAIGRVRWFDAHVVAGRMLVPDDGA